jgi:hypothetical protein
MSCPFNGTGLTGTGSYCSAPNGKQTLFETRASLANSTMGHVAYDFDDEVRH